MARPLIVFAAVCIAFALPLWCLRDVDRTSHPRGATLDRAAGNDSAHAGSAYPYRDPGGYLRPSPLANGPARGVRIRNARRVQGSTGWVNANRNRDKRTVTTTTIEERRTTNDERKHRNPESLILATDLDGTFLGGSAEDQRRLYQTLRNMPGSVLIFVTGRGLESVLPLLGDPSIPDPDYIICDVGATVVHGETLQPVQ